MNRSRLSRLLLAAALGTSLCCLSTPLTFDVVKQATVQLRLNQWHGNDTAREATLYRLFKEAGCPAPHLTEQAVPDRKQPNVICVLPGTSSETIVVGAHFDHVDAGDGIIDNWSGAATLPSLLQSLSGSAHRHTFILLVSPAKRPGCSAQTTT